MRRQTVEDPRFRIHAKMQRILQRRQNIEQHSDKRPRGKLAVQRVKQSLQRGMGHMKTLRREKPRPPAKAVAAALAAGGARQRLPVQAKRCLPQKEPKHHADRQEWREREQHQRDVEQRQRDSQLHQASRMERKFAEMRETGTLWSPAATAAPRVAASPIRAAKQATPPRPEQQEEQQERSDEPAGVSSENPSAAAEPVQEQPPTQQTNESNSADAVRLQHPNRKVVEVQPAEAGCGSLPAPGSRASAALANAPSEVMQLVQMLASRTAEATEPSSAGKTVSPTEVPQPSTPASVQTQKPGLVTGRAQAFTLSLLSRTTSLPSSPPPQQQPLPLPTAASTRETESSTGVIGSDDSDGDDLGFEVDSDDESSLMADDDPGALNLGQIDSTAESYAVFCAMLGVQAPIGSTSILTGSGPWIDGAKTNNNALVINDTTAALFMQPLMAIHGQQSKAAAFAKLKQLSFAHSETGRDGVSGSAATVGGANDDSNEDDDLEDIEMDESNEVVVGSRLYASDAEPEQPGDKMAAAAVDNWLDIDDFVSDRDEDSDDGDSNIDDGNRQTTTGAEDTPATTAAEDTAASAMSNCDADIEDGNGADDEDEGEDGVVSSCIPPPLLSSLARGRPRRLPYARSSYDSGCDAGTDTSDGDHEDYSELMRRLHKAPDLLPAGMASRFPLPATSGGDSGSAQQRERLDSNDFVVLEEEGEDEEELVEPQHSPVAESNQVDTASAASTTPAVATASAAVSPPALSSSTSRDSWEDAAAALGGDGRASPVSPTGSHRNEENGSVGSESWDILPEPAADEDSDSYRAFLAAKAKAKAAKRQQADDNNVQPFELEPDFDYDGCECVPRFGAGLEAGS